MRPVVGVAARSLSFLLTACVRCKIGQVARQQHVACDGSERSNQRSRPGKSLARITQSVLSKHTPLITNIDGIN
ncbi:hypothetical protein PR002_g27374 [Phytophthora rubi]|uniref:Secreted protein n=1 Tax=Phytophthora rubi TaxID=129364 RepID=A0A6A3HJ38_9STRA|nr:hypothetical protein PR002_g27374 [Phytophthora rubi]